MKEPKIGELLKQNKERKAKKTKSPMLFERGILFQEQIDKLRDFEFSTQLRLYFSEIVKSYLDNKVTDLKNELAYGAHRKMLIQLNNHKIGLIGRKSGTTHRQTKEEKDSDPVIPKYCSGDRFYVYDIKDASYMANRSVDTQSIVMSCLFDLYLRLHPEVEKNHEISTIEFSFEELEYVNERFGIKTSNANLAGAISVLASPSRKVSEDNKNPKIAYWKLNEAGKREKLVFYAEIVQSFAELRSFKYIPDQKAHQFEQINNEIKQAKKHSKELFYSFDQAHRAFLESKNDEVNVFLNQTKKETDKVISDLRQTKKNIINFNKK